MNVHNVKLGLSKLRAGTMGGVAVVMSVVTSAMAGTGLPAPRPITGQGNNVAHPLWGTPQSQLLRGPSGAHYADGISAMGGSRRPSPRLISDAVFAQSKSAPNKSGMSDFVWAWGQFVDHDLTLVPGPNESAPIPIPLGDPFFDPGYTGTQLIPFHRAVFDGATGTSAANPRQQANQITAYLDASMVYGSDAGRAMWLRTLSGGRMKTTPTPVGELLPFNDGTQANAGSPEVPSTSTSLFVAGDIRANEQPVLSIMHTLLVREHNWHAARIAASHPEASDEFIYQAARRRVIAEVEHITIDEFLPAILGPGALEPYKGYDANVDPGIANAFAAAAFRLGHTLLSPELQRALPDGKPSPAGPVPLRDAFFGAAPPLLQKEGIEPLLAGLATQRSQEMDNLVIDDVRNFLFGKPGAGGLDLVSLNIQRGRDHGLPDFNTLRADYGLPKRRTFRDIVTGGARTEVEESRELGFSESSTTQMAAVLAALYGDVDNVDAFVGLLVEGSAGKDPCGDTLRAVVVDQFRRLRSGDRYWYEATMSGAELQEVKETRLSDIIRRNTGIRELQDDVFHMRSKQ